MSNGEACVYEASGNPEAQQVRTFLEAHGIPCFLRGESMHNLGFTLDGLGLVRICVADSDADRARDLLARAEAGDLRLSDPLDDADAPT